MWAALILALGHLPAAAGHAYLAVPASRNVVAGDNCMHCLQAGGPNTVSGRSKGTWPTALDPASHGLCGDPVQGRSVVPFKQEPYMVAGDVQATYTAGSVVEFRIGVSTHHMGHYEFRICNRPLDAASFADAAEGQKCLDEYVLERAKPAADCKANGPADCQPIDENHPGRWYLPPPGHDVQVAGADWSDGDAASSTTAGEYHKMKYVIPAGLQCQKCTLQWYWSTGNSCLYDKDYITYFTKMQGLGWNAGAWAPQAVASWATEASVTCNGKGQFGEEFWNCADIEVLPGGPTVAPTPAPPTPPTPVPVATTATTTKPPGPCVAAWGKCGGKEHTGPTCCVSGSYCKFSNEWYSQCTPGTAPAPPPTPQPMTPAPTPAPSNPAPKPVAPTPAPASAVGQCTCAASTTWDGSFSHFAGLKSFCDQNFGGTGPYISAGGGLGAGGGWSEAGPCTDGQYSFSNNQWTITMSSAQGQGKVPYRAFAYTQFCNGKPYSDCWAGQQTVSFSFRFKVENVATLGAFVKLLFWTDAGNILGLLPPNHPKGKGQLRLVAFMGDDYPNSWAGDAAIVEGSWNQVQVDFTPSTKAVGITLNGAEMVQGTIPVDMLGASNGPQIGIYSFDFGGGSWPSQPVSLSLSDPCIGTLTCDAAPGPSPATTTATLPATTKPPTTTVTTPKPAPAPTPKPAPAPTPKPAEPEPEPEAGPEPEPEAEPEPEGADGFHPVDGGKDRACRGGNKLDESTTYYSVAAGAASLEDCKARCLKHPHCMGVEFSLIGGQARCAVWTRECGILASVASAGSTCLRYSGPLPEAEPEPEPETSAPTPEPEPEPLSCATFCGLTDLSALGQTCKGATAETCIKGYFRKGNIVAPCAWTAGCGCYADGEMLRECPDLDTVCAPASFLQVQRSGKKLRGATLGNAFIQDGNVSLYRSEVADEDVEGMSAHEEL